MKLRLLLVAPRFPWPPDKGDRLTVYHYLRLLSERYDVALATFISKDEYQYIPKIQGFCPQSLFVEFDPYRALLRTATAVPGSEPLQIAYYHSQDMHRELSRFATNWKPDIAYFHTVRMAPYGQDTPGIPRILGLQISMALNSRRLATYTNRYWERLLHSEECQRIGAYERMATGWFDMSVLISRKDLDELSNKQASPPRNVHVLPHGVDADHFRPASEPVQEDSSLVITGNMAYPPNRDAVLYMTQEILPIIQLSIPDVKFYVVGKNPSLELKSLHNGTSVIVTGEVDDTRPWLHKAQVAVVPIRVAAGLQNKLLEAMASGLPVVATSASNEGIGAESDRHLLIRDNPADFAKAVVDLLQNPQQRVALGTAAREFITERFTWSYFLKDLCDKFEQLL